jgi:signal recognition particle subunit SRP54
MLEAVTKGFKNARNKLQGKAELTHENVDDALRDIRVALLEADVQFDVVKRFLARVKDKAIGEVVQLKTTDKKGKKIEATPGDHFIKICHDELEALMGPVDTSLKFAEAGKPTGIMFVGLQGSGKTTTIAKLGRLLAKQGKKPMLVGADIYRPAAVEQLRQLAQQLDMPFFSREGVKPPELCRAALEEAREKHRDVVLYDTAGRLAIDEELMHELEEIKSQTAPENILLVCDSMIGQDAVRTAAEFDRRLQLDGFIMTKLDGDARGGAALSIKEVTGKPIKFIGMGEALDKLEEFRPEGIASRILGFGDIVGLMQDFEQVADEKKAEEDAEKILTGQFDMEDFVNQIKLVRKMGSIGDLLDKFPIFGELPEGITFDDKELVKTEAVIASMTKKEKANPDIITPDRTKRIAKGSGRTQQEVQGLLNRFFAMRKVMKQIGSAPGLLSRLPGFRQIAQLKQMKGQEEELKELFGDMPGGIPGVLPPAGGAGSHAAAVARARMMGYAPPPRVVSDDEKRRLREKKKRERQNKKKGRKRK